MIVCQWSTCDRADDEFALLSLDGETWWCCEHIDDEFLPSLELGVLGYCAQCDGPCHTWLSATPLHPHCLRKWVAGVVDRTKLVGAYARRKK